MVTVGERAEAHGLVLADRLRDAVPELRVLLNGGGGSFKNQFKRADKSGAQLALILGDSELDAGQVGIKPLRGGEQELVAEADLPARLQCCLSG
jgi:histidyl-tRNA synthetase